MIFLSFLNNVPYQDHNHHHQPHNCHHNYHHQNTGNQVRNIAIIIIIIIIIIIWKGCEKGSTDFCTNKLLTKKFTDRGYHQQLS